MCKRKKTIMPQKCPPQDMPVWDCHKVPAYVGGGIFGKIR